MYIIGRSYLNNSRSLARESLQMVENNELKLISIGLSANIIINDGQNATLPPLCVFINNRKYPEIEARLIKDGFLPLLDKCGNRVFSKEIDYMGASTKFPAYIIPKSTDICSIYGDLEVRVKNKRKTPEIINSYSKELIDEYNSYSQTNCVYSAEINSKRTNKSNPFEEVDDYDWLPF